MDKLAVIFQEMVMSSTQESKVDVAQLEVLVQEDIKKCLQAVTTAVNQAQDGAIIDQSEEAVREALARLRQAVYEKAIQLKVDAAEAAFSPSSSRRCRSAQQGSSGRQP